MPQFSKMSRLTKGYLIAIIGTALWSSTAIFIRYLTSTLGMPPLILAFWRDTFVCVALVLAFLIIRPSLFSVERRRLPFFILYGFILAVFNSLWTISVALNGAAVSTVLAYSSAGFTAILGWRMYGERFDFWKILAVTFSLSGCAFVSGAYDLGLWQVNTLGVITGLLSGVLFAAYSLMGKESSHKNINPWSTLLYSFFFAALFLLIFNLIPGLPGNASGFERMLPDLPALGWLILILLAFIPTVSGYGLYTVSLTYLPASIANLIATMEPAFTAVQAYLILDERLNLPQILGSILIILGVVIVRLSEKGEPVSSSPQ